MKKFYLMGKECLFFPSHASEKSGIKIISLSLPKMEYSPVQSLNVSHYNCQYFFWLTQF